MNFQSIMTGGVFFSEGGGPVVPTAFNFRARSARGNFFVYPATTYPLLRKNTAFPGFNFSMISRSTGDPEPGIISITAKRSLDGGAITTCDNVVYPVGSGVYAIDLSAADLNGDFCLLIFTAEGVLPVIIPINIIRLTKNKAYNNFTFMMLDAATNAPKSGLSVTAQRSINGADMAACANSVTEISDGAYSINFDATDLNGSSVLLYLSSPGARTLSMTIITEGY